MHDRVCLSRHMLQEKAKDLAKLCAANPATQQSEHSMPYRRYIEWGHPHLSGFYWSVYDELPQDACQFLMHTGGKGTPRCLCVTCTGAESSYIIHQDDSNVEVTAPEMQMLVHTCLDRESIVFFSVALTRDKPSSYRNHALMNLCAQ